MDSLSLQVSSNFLEKSQLFNLHFNNPKISPFNVPEIMFLIFMRTEMQASLNQKCLVFLETSSSRQISFNEWVKKNYNNEILNPEVFNITKIISSIWRKTITEIYKKLEPQDIEKIENEKQCQKIVNTRIKELAHTENLIKVFTPRQSKFLLKTADLVV